MLVLSRRKDESVVIGGKIKVVVVDIHGDKVRLGIEAPADVEVFRSELLEKRRQTGNTADLSDKNVGFAIPLTAEDREEARKVLSADEQKVERVLPKAGERKSSRDDKQYVSLEISLDAGEAKRRVRKNSGISSTHKNSRVEGTAVDKIDR